jgi:hypothetical protein
VDKRDCVWIEEQKSKKSELWPEGSTPVWASHLADWYWQYMERRLYRLPLRSEEEVKVITRGGVKYCVATYPEFVQHRTWVYWCIKLYRFRRKGRARKAVGWGIMIAGCTASAVVPVGVFLGWWTATAGLIAIAAGGGSAAAIAQFVANGALGVSTALEAIPPHVGIETAEGWLGVPEPASPSVEIISSDKERECHSNNKSHDVCGVK